MVQSSGVLDFLADVADGLADIASGVDAAFGDGPLSPGAVPRLRAAYRELAAELVRVREELAKSAAAAPGVDLDATDLGRRRAALRAQLRALAAELGDRVPRIPGLDIDSGPDPESSKEAQRYIERLRGQVEALRDLSHEEQVLEAIRSGALKGATEADQQAALRLAGELDAAKAQEEAEQRRRAAAESDRALASLRRQEIDEEAAALEELAARHRDLRGELAGLAGPYAVAVHAAEEWRREQHAALAALTAQGHATEALGDIVEEVYGKKIAAAVREASEADADLARQRLRNATDLKSGIDRALQDLGAELNDFGALSERAVTGAVRGMEDALVRFVSTGKLSFKSLANSIIADLARIAIRQQITLPLLGSLANALGGTPIEGTVQHAGGVAGAPGGVRRVVPRAAFAGAPRLHRGGLASDEIPTILRRGEGVFTPAQMRALGPRLSPGDPHRVHQPGHGAAAGRSRPDLVRGRPAARGAHRDRGRRIQRPDRADDAAPVQPLRPRVMTDEAATWPGYARLSAAEERTWANDVVRTVYDDGTVQQRRVATTGILRRRIVAQIPGRRAAEFDDWLYTSAHARFSGRDPLDGVTRQWRVVGGVGGTRWRQVGRAPGGLWWEVEMTLEATRAAPRPVAAMSVPEIEDLSLAVGIRLENDIILPEAMNGVAPYTYALTPDLPTGLIWTAATRNISGNPSQGLRATEFTYTATDADGTQASVRFSVTVNVYWAPFSSHAFRPRYASHRALVPRIGSAEPYFPASWSIDGVAVRPSYLHMQHSLISFDVLRASTVNISRLTSIIERRLRLVVTHVATGQQSGALPICGGGDSMLWAVSHAPRVDNGRTGIGVYILRKASTHPDRRRLSGIPPFSSLAAMWELIGDGDFRLDFHLADDTG